MGYPAREIPDLSPVHLKSFVPAIRHAENVLSREAERLSGRVEAFEYSVLLKSKGELQELRGLIKHVEREE